MRLRDANLDRMTAYALIDALDETHPTRTPQPGDSRDQLMFDAGKRDLIDTLIALRRKIENG